MEWVRRSSPKFLLFFSSYAPLFAMLAIRIEDRRWAGACLLISAVSVIVLLTTLKLNGRIEPLRYKIIESREAGPEAASYLATYLLPVVMVSQPSVRDGLIAALFLITAASIFIRSSIVQINPVLYVLGYQVLAVTSEDGYNGYLLSKGKAKAGSSIMASRMGDGVLIQKRVVPV